MALSIGHSRGFNNRSWRLAGAVVVLLVSAFGLRSNAHAIVPLLFVPTTTTVAGSANPSTSGQSVTVTATVIASPSCGPDCKPGTGGGTITFKASPRETVGSFGPLG